MRKFLTVVFVLTAFTLSLEANNLQVSNVQLVDQDVLGGYTHVYFDLSWDNSWRDGTNFDAAWVFIKWRNPSESNPIWRHAWLSTSEVDHSVTTSTPASKIEVGSTDIGGTDYGMGVFIYRISNAAGSNSFEGVKLRWNYGLQSLTGTDEVEIKVFAIEMVNIPQANFALGDGSGTTTNSFYKSDGLSGGQSTFYQVSSQSSIDVGTGVDELWALSNGNLPSDGSTTNSNYPTGYNSFFIMKYELSSGQYRDFLNMLTYNQQVARTAISPSNSAGWALAGTASDKKRSNIKIETSGSSSTGTPAVYGCNLDNDSNFNEIDDGEYIACNFLSFGDLSAYADWAGLRPFTELEYEKACRGDVITSSGEYAWGNSSLYGSTYSLEASELGKSTEVTVSQSTTAGVGNALNFATVPSQLGPFRTGIFANSGTGKATSGATKYGVMEMSGNVWELIVSIQSTDFQGSNGDGNLTTAFPTDWPANAGARGGNFNEPKENCRVSDREFSGASYSGRANTFGGRLARTAN